MAKKIFRALLMSSAIAVFTAAAQASPTPQQDSRRAPDEEQKSIVGSWMATLDNGERLLFSFTSDGIDLSSVQSEVSLTNPVLTPGHGVWTHLGGRQFAITDMVILYDIQTGEFQGSGKLRALLTLDKPGDRMSGTAKIEIFGPDGSVVVTFSHVIRFARIKVERLD